MTPSVDPRGACRSLDAAEALLMLAAPLLTARTVRRPFSFLCAEMGHFECL